MILAQVELRLCVGEELALAGKAGRAFLPEQEGVPAYDELILVAHEARTNDAKIKAFLGALAQQTLRHKSAKPAFRRIFWLTVVVNVAAFVAAFTPWFRS